MNKILTLLFICFTVSGCTVSVILTDTHGNAEDVVDSTPTQTTDVDAEVPIKPLAYRV